VSKGSTVIVINARGLKGLVADCAWLLNKPKNRLHDGIMGVCLDPLIFVREFDSDRAIEKGLSARRWSGVLIWAEN
jgi:hypothetical protein